MQKRIDQALELFSRGYNCSQSTLAACSDLLGIDQDLALKLSCGFGAGLGALRRTCGVVSVLALAVSLHYTDPKDPAAKNHVYDVVKKVILDFEAKSGSTTCAELLEMPNFEERAKNDPRLAHFPGIRPCALYVVDGVELIGAIVNGQYD